MGSRAGAEKVNQKLKAEYGYTVDGKSIYHQMIGAKAKSKGKFLLDLQANDPDRLAEIGRKGGLAKARNAQQKTD